MEENINTSLQVSGVDNILISWDKDNNNMVVKFDGASGRTIIQTDMIQGRLFIEEWLRMHFAPVEEQAFIPESERIKFN